MSSYITSFVDFLGEVGQIFYPSEVKSVDFRTRCSIGREVWEKLGSLSEVPDIPESLLNALEQDCPYWPGNPVKTTSRLVLIPAKIDGKSVSPGMLREKTAELLSINASPDLKFFGDFTNVEIEKPYWALVTILPIPESERKSVAIHEQMMKPGYRIPKMIELVAFFTGARINDEQDLLHGQSSRCQEDHQYSITATDRELVEVSYLDYTSGTFAVRTK
ncbi:MAG: hypothetical protein H7A42_09300 [Chlamydiales bacterium]|nr:hypothetical protein [Chlamydiales bacterium]